MYWPIRWGYLLAHLEAVSLSPLEATAVSPLVAVSVPVGAGSIVLLECSWLTVILSI